MAGQLDPVIAPAVRNAEVLSAREYLARTARLRALVRSAAPRLDAVDVIASPTLCLTPPLMSDVADADSHLRVNRRIVRNTVAVNYLGLCAITMPVGRDRAGMPAEPCPWSSAMAIRRQPGPRNLSRSTRAATPSRTVSAVWTQWPVRSRFRLRAPSGLVLARVVGFVSAMGAGRDCLPFGHMDPLMAMGATEVARFLCLLPSMSGHGHPTTSKTRLPSRLAEGPLRS